MLITLIQNDSLTGSPLTIDVSADRAEAVISAMATDGWRVLSKLYGPVSPVVDSLQVALLEVSALPAGAPIRVAVELGASAAILSAPLWAAAGAELPRSRSGRDRRHGQDVIHH
jgi:hypothetical protein